MIAKESTPFFVLFFIIVNLNCFFYFVLFFRREITDDGGREYRPSLWWFEGLVLIK